MAPLVSLRPAMSGLGRAGLVAGVVADWAVGDPRRWHPVAGFGSVAVALERRWWRPSRAAGVAYAIVLVGGAAVAVGGADRRLVRRPVARMLLTGLVTWAALGGRSLAEAAHQLAEAVRCGDLAAARRLATRLVGRDPSGLDGSELCRAALESVAENTADAVVGPLLWGVLAGPTGVAVYRAANTLDAMVGHHSPRYERFGWAAARLDDTLTWPAARLGAGLTCLGVRLGGTNRYGDRVERRPALDSGAAPGPGDVDRAVRLSVLVGSAAAVLAALVGRR